MVVGKLVTKLIQSLPSWEVTKYYGRVCIFQLKCLKYRMQTSEAWFNFKCKFMPGSLREEAECENVNNKIEEETLSKQRKVQGKKLSLETLSTAQTAKLKQNVNDKTNVTPSTSLESLDSSCMDNEYATKESKDFTKLNENYKQDQKYNVKSERTAKPRRKVKQYQR